MQTLPVILRMILLIMTIIKIAKILFYDKVIIRMIIELMNYDENMLSIVLTQGVWTLQGVVDKNYDIKMMLKATIFLTNRKMTGLTSQSYKWHRLQIIKCQTSLNYVIVCRNIHQSQMTF